MLNDIELGGGISFHDRIEAAQAKKQVFHFRQQKRYDLFRALLHARLRALPARPGPR